MPQLDREAGSARILRNRPASERMPRTEMDDVARERLLDALMIELAEKGYRSMALADALRPCGVSMPAFAAEFGDKDGGLFAAYEQLTERLRQRTAEACAEATGEAWPQRVRWGLQALLEELARDPRLAKALIHTFPSIDPAARLRYQDFLGDLAPLLREGREYAELGGELPVEVEMLAVGAAEAILFEEIEAGRAASLPSLCPSVLFSVLVPFLGPEAASKEMETARQPR